MMCNSLNNKKAPNDGIRLAALRGNSVTYFSHSPSLLLRVIVKRRERGGERTFGESSGSLPMGTRKRLSEKGLMPESGVKCSKILATVLLLMIPPNRAKNWITSVYSR